MNFDKGKRFRVIKEGARLTGMRAIAPYAWDGWARALTVGDILTSAGTSQTFGDGVPALKWRGADDEHLASDCIFEPIQGGMWGGQIPADGYLEPLD